MKKHKKLLIRSKVKVKQNEPCPAANANICIMCGREIPEGMLVCIECELGTTPRRCTICNRPISESDSICPDCKGIIFYEKQGGSKIK